MMKKTSTATRERGHLQNEVMAIVWRLGAARVEEVRAAQPARDRSAYTTLQTVLNRLVGRGLLTRERSGNAYTYRPAHDESEFLSEEIAKRLSAASPGARTAALINLVGALDPGELDEVARNANRIRRARAKE